MNLNEIKRNELTDSQRMLVAQCDNIAETLDDLAHGRVYVNGDDPDGDLTTEATRTDDGEETDNDPARVADWLDRQLEISRVFRSPRGEVTGGRICCAIGGPNVWVVVDDGWCAVVRGAWGFDVYERELSRDAEDMLVDGLSACYAE